MDEAREVETKLAVPDDLVLPALHGIKGVHEVRPSSRSLTARYLDTDDLVLARAGITLRHRTGEGRARWTLKLGTGTGDGLDRQELSVVGRADAVPQELAGLLVARLRGRPLGVVVELRTRRTSWVLAQEDGRELLEVVDDRVEARRATDVQGWREVEVEQRPDAGPAADRVARRVLDLLHAAGAELADQTPKAVRALGVAPVQLRRVRAKDPAGDLVRWSLTTRGAQLLERDVDVRRGAPDAVHQFRVTCRRLRSDLRTFRPLLADARAEQLRDELSWLADSFGAARDLEVLRARLRATAAQDPPLEGTAVDALLAGEEQDAVRRGLEALGSPRYLELLRVLEDLASSAELTAAAADPCRVALPPLIAQAWRALGRRADRLDGDSPDRDWHKARIAAKRARYTAETAAEVLGKPARRQARAAERVQEHLGEHQDAVISIDTVLRLAADPGADAALGVLCGRLAEREHVRAVTARRAFLQDWPPR